ncbi:MAG TPA: spore coat U domain-containing protein [Thermoanaerobaculia bacterium]|nr:spore coat U domain-containing protein [Thermoanaerobaculia bacterium]
MRRLGPILLALAALIPGSAYAINCSWDIVPTNMNFGTYTPFSSAPVTATAAFQFTCTPPATATLILSRGVSPTYNPRTMTRTVAPAYTMNYNLFMDAANAIIWGDGTSGTQYLTFTASPGNKIIGGTIYGTIPGNLDVAPGTYTDTIQATLDWGTGSSQQFFTVTATVSAECTVSTSAVSFGLYDPVSANAAAPKDATGTVNVYCTAGTLATVALDLGSHAAGSTRKMLGGTGDLLQYELYRDAARTVVWNAVNTDSGTSASKTTPINGGFMAYGRIFAGQDVRIGGYSDTVLVTVNY